MLLGAHESIAGGPKNAFARAVQDGAECVQIFTKSARGWKARPLDAAEAEQFRAEGARTGLVPVAHGSYLVNMASEDRALREKSLRCVLDELTRCEALGVPFLVYHPGAAADPRRGARAAASLLDEALSAAGRIRTQILLENTAGQGASIGHAFEQVAEILGAARRGDRLGVCLDTCHAWAAGYDMGSEKGYDLTMAAFDQAVGVERIKAFHLNDCKKERGCRVDRHENIGQGKMGTGAFRALVNDPRFAAVPGALETPEVERYPENLALLKSFRRRPFDKLRAIGPRRK